MGEHITILGHTLEPEASGKAEIRRISGSFFWILGFALSAYSFDLRVFCQ